MILCNVIYVVYVVIVRIIYLYHAERSRSVLVSTVR